MKPGTPGFVGGRLREAREARGLTKVQLAEMVGLTAGAITGYENGSLSPRPENRLRLAAVLDKPVTFFGLPARAADDKPTFYRSLSAASKRDRLAASLRLAWMGDIVRCMEQYVELPDNAFPTLVHRRGVLEDWAIEDAAIELRRRWEIGDGPVHNVVALVELKGGVVARAEAESAFIDAFSKIEDGRPCILLGNEKGSATRSRFDAAHEVGHMVIHSDVTTKQVASPADLKEIEREANAFASAFLMPAAAFIDDLHIPTLERMRALKPKWKVSVAAMLRRSRSLGIVSEANAERMWVSLSRRGWRRTEPDDEIVPLERPALIAKAFQIVVDGGYAFPLELLDGTHHSVSDVLRYSSLMVTLCRFRVGPSADQRPVDAESIELSQLFPGVDQLSVERSNPNRPFDS